MRTVVLGPPPAELEALIERRRRLGQDLYDEVWEGEHHVVPGPSGRHAHVQARLIALLDPTARARGLWVSGPCNVGRPDDFRVPDAAVHRTPPEGTWPPPPALVVEVTSPDDESYAKFDFYARQGVDEVLIADPDTRELRIWHRDGERYEEADRSEMLGTTSRQMADQIDWPRPASA